MTARVHHLNCGTMRLPGAELACHVLAIESDAGIVLIDAGFGTGDIAAPGPRLGAVRRLLRPALVREQTALWQLRQLGFAASDVRHVVLTHFDLDHAGGLSDFPAAAVHLTAAEAAGATARTTWLERRRYPAAQQAYGPRLVPHAPGGITWNGLAGAVALEEVLPGLLLIPLPGHSRGHAGVALREGDGWLLHAGDAFYHRGTFDPRAPIPPVLRLQEAALAFDRRALARTQAQLAELWSEPSLTVVCSHDPALLGG